MKFLLTILQEILLLYISGYQTKDSSKGHLSSVSLG